MLRVVIDDGNVIDYSVLALSEFIDDLSTSNRDRAQLEHALRAVRRISVARFRGLRDHVGQAYELDEIDAQTCLDALRRHLIENRLPDYLQTSDPDQIARSAAHLEASLVSSS